MASERSSLQDHDSENTPVTYLSIFKASRSNFTAGSSASSSCLRPSRYPRVFVLYKDVTALLSAKLNDRSVEQKIRILFAVSVSQVFNNRKDHKIQV